MKPAWRISCVVTLVLVAVGGCAGGRTAARRSAAAQVAQTNAPSVPSKTSEGPAHDPSPIRLASAPLPPLESQDGPAAEREAGTEFTRPPAVPYSPPAIGLNQQFGPQGAPLSLEFFESMACQNNPTLLQAQGQIQGELGKAIQAGLWPNPTLSYVQEQIGVEGTPGEFVGGVVQQRIVTGRKLDLSRAKYLATTRAAEWHALEQQYRVLNDVRVHYFRARGRWELVQIHRELLKSAEDNVLTTREQYNVGQASRAQVHLANVALQRSRLDLLQVENDFREAFETLTALSGIDLPLAPLSTPLEGDMTPIDWHDALSRTLTEAPQILAARNKLESDRITVRRETVEPIPDLVVQAGTGYNHETNQTVGMAQLSIEVPLFDYNQGTIRQAEADFARQQGELRRVELDLKQELARTYRNYLTGLQFAQNYAEVILPEARDAYELQLRSYRDDRIRWPEVLQTQRDYFMLRAEYVRNLIAWREAEVLIAGFLLHGGLQAPNTPPPPGHIDATPKPR